MTQQFHELIFSFPYGQCNGIFLISFPEKKIPLAFPYCCNDSPHTSKLTGLFPAYLVLGEEKKKKNGNPVF